MNVKIKGKVYRTVVRPALVYEAEIWALKEAHENILDVAEMRMLRWMCGVTKLDKIIIEILKGDNESGGGSKGIPGNDFEVVWAAYM